MKMQRQEFKSIVKEALKELINEGALNHLFQQTPQQPVNPQARLLAGGNRLAENVLADAAANTAPGQLSAEMPWNVHGGGMMQQQQQFVNGMEPAFNPGFQQTQQQQPPQQQTQQPQDGLNTHWARLAFNSPIGQKSKSSAVSSGYIDGVLPGVNSRGFNS